jgi:tetratricopeptide (TPR) repeat protein
VRLASPAAVLVGALLAGVFTTRAVTGVLAASAYRRTWALDAGGGQADPGPLFDRAAVGANRAELLWRAGRSRLAAWRRLPMPERNGRRGAEALRTAAARFLEERVVTPGSVWPISGLADVYACRESVARAERPTDLALLERGPWALMGDDGRVAIGLTRAAIDREPSSFDLRDRLVLFLENNGLHEDALRAMEESARVVPDFNAHPDFTFESLPRDLVETFWRTSRALRPEDAPLLRRDRYLLSLGQLGRRLGHLAEAEHDLRAVLGMPGTELGHAEDAFHLALVLIDLGRLDEAETMLARAAREPVFELGVAGTRARIATQRERWPEALEQLRECRRLRPRELWILLEFARVAQKAGAWDQAEEALRWAMLVHPTDAVPHRAIVEMFLAKGERQKARQALDQYLRSFGRTAEVPQMEQALAQPLDPAPR